MSTFSQKLASLANQARREVFEPVGGLSATDVQAALAELDTEKQTALSSAIDVTVGGLTVSNDLNLTGVISPAQLTANTNDWAPTGIEDAFLIRVSTDASRDLTGIADQGAGRTLKLTNVGSNNLVLKDEDANSTAANRFALSGDLTLGASQSVILHYDETASRWCAGAIYVPGGGAGDMLAATYDPAGISEQLVGESLLRTLKGGDIASASPLVIDTDGSFFDVTGTTGFSAMTVAANRLFVLQFDAALTITHGASLALPGAANFTTAAGDRALCYSTAADTVIVLSIFRASVTGALKGVTGSDADVVTGTAPAGGMYPMFNGDGDLVAAAQGGDIASASPLVIDTDGVYFDVTGTTGFSAMTVAGGKLFALQFDGALTITHGASIDLPGEENYTTAAGDRMICFATAADTVQVLSVFPAARKVAPLESFVIACSDETSDLTTGTAKVTFRMPYAFTLLAGADGVKASVTTAPTGAALTVDINEGGTTILSTKLTIDATEKTSATAATPPVISDTALAADAEITIDIDAVGSTVAGAGLKVMLVGYQS